MRFIQGIADRVTGARLGLIQTAHGVVETPVFMPVGTLGAVKGIPPDTLEKAGYQIMLANTYHLLLRPGQEVIKKLGGLHNTCGWTKAILTDSGGYQVFSLAHLRKISSNGVAFRSHIDGSNHFLSPEAAIEFQEQLGSDIMMVLDECPAADKPREYVQQSAELTTRWALRSLEARKSKNALFAIVQGGMFADLRQKHSQELGSYPFDGFAVGGLSVGESQDKMFEMLAASLESLPKSKPRYLMGVGRPGQILTAISMGVDMFDCVLPTRGGRNGLLFTWKGEMSIKQQRFRSDTRPVDEQCNCPICARFPRAFLRHLFVTSDFSAPVYNSIHNIYFFADLMRKIRAAIAQRRFLEFLRHYGPLLSRKLPPEE